MANPQFVLIKPGPDGKVSVCLSFLLLHADYGIVSHTEVRNPKSYHAAARWGSGCDNCSL